MSDIVAVEYYILLDGDAEKIGLRREDDSILEVYIGETSVPFISDIQSVSGSIALAADFDFIELTLTDNLTISNITSLVLNSTFTLVCKQDASGGRTIIWPDEIKWANGVAPSLSTDADAIDIFTFFTMDAGVSWYGFQSGVSMAVPS